jgi:hypothetical protein
MEQTFIIPQDIENMTIGLNVRPIIFDKVTFQGFLNEPALHSMGFIIGSYKTKGLPRSIQAIHYGLFDSSGLPFFFDGKNITKNKEKNEIKSLFQDNPILTFGILKNDILDITNFEEGNDRECILCTFFKDNGDPNDPNATPRFRIVFETIKAFSEGGGGGPGGDKVTNPYP